MRNLDQVLIVNPKCEFVEIANAMARMGWQRDAFELAAPSLIANEPEVATWSWMGHKPFVVYSFNPVVKMRVLDVAGVPPALREGIAQQLPLLDHLAIEKLFESEDVRIRLLGLWAVQETERVDLLETARKLTQDAEPILAEQARDVCARLERINQARKEVLVQMRIMEEATPALIRRLNDPLFIQTLKPSRSDLQKLFDAELVDVAQQAIEKVYSDPGLRIPSAIDAHIKAVACPAGLLRWPNMLSDKFPGGYRDLAGWMVPGRIWVCWKLESPGATVSYDGLVWLDDHWCWLPKIFRFLVPYLMSGTDGTRKH